MKTTKKKKQEECKCNGMNEHEPLTEEDFRAIAKKVNEDIIMSAKQ
jgi:TRAP-type C4-dicarboxylate transport system substrate-binding protein